MRLLASGKAKKYRVGLFQGFSVLPVVFAVVISGFLPTFSIAGQADAKKGELKDLKSRIKVLRRDVAAGEKSKTNVADKLRETESAISDVSEQLRQLSAENTKVRRQLAQLESQSQDLARKRATLQSQLARILNQQFARGETEALRLLLSGQDPNQTARDRYFLTQLSRAKVELLQQLETATAEKKILAEAVREQQTKLAEIERRQQASRLKLLERKKQRQATLASIGDRLKAQRREIDSLKRDERRLSKLITQLAKAQEARRKARNARNPSPKVGAGGTAAPAGKTLKSYDPGQLKGTFAALRGKMLLPVKGHVAGRFGHVRDQGGAAWRGLFIRAAEGAEVMAVAGGAVVFSDWLRGFGNLMIIDHGDDFLSVYGNNESLLASVGQVVKAGEAVATVGNSGGNPDSGLYFELRHRGEPFDPLKWAGN